MRTITALLLALALALRASDDLPARKGDARVTPDIAMSADEQLAAARQQIALLQAELADCQQQLAAAKSAIQVIQKRLAYQAFIDREKKALGKENCDLTTEQAWVCEPRQ